MAEQKQFKAGTTIHSWIYVRDLNDLLIDPTSITITITDPNGVVKVNAVSMTKESTGKYYHDWQSSSADATGYYDVTITSLSGGFTVKSQQLDAFEVV